MFGIADIILALIDCFPWFVLGYIVHRACPYNPKKTFINLFDKIKISTEK